MITFQWRERENGCFGCGENPWGLKLKFKKKNEWLIAKTSLDRHYQGFQTTAHGGIIATLIDEAGAWAGMVESGNLAPSFKLNCKFIKPVPLEEEIVIRSKVIEQRHGIIKSRVEVLNNAREHLAEGTVSLKRLEEEPTQIQEQLLNELKE